MGRFNKGLAAAFAAVLAVTALSACSSDTAKKGDGKQLSVYATTGYLADAVANIAPDAKVTTMVGPGGDPHTYQPSTKDIETIKSADVVFWNGLHLEAQMLDELNSLGDKQLAVGDKLPADKLIDWPEKDDKGNALKDPHIWNSPELWSNVVGQVADKLAKVDPENAEKYKKNATDYQAKIEAANKEAKALLDAIPADKRVLITGHDAFNYFGKTYNLEVKATDFVSSEAKLSPEQLNELAKLIATKKLPVIFQDNQANPQAITSLKEAVRALGWSVEVSGEELYADSLGEGKGVDTYLGVFKHNAETVAKALGKK